MRKRRNRDTSVTWVVWPRAGFERQEMFHLRAQLLKNILDVPILLKSVGKDLEPTPGLALIVRLAKIGHDQAIEIAIADAVEDSAVLGSKPTSSALHRVTDLALQTSDSDVVSSLGGSLKSLTSSLDVIINIGGVIAKVQGHG